MFCMMFQVLELPELEKEINVLIRLCEQFDHISNNYWRNLHPWTVLVVI